MNLDKYRAALPKALAGWNHQLASCIKARGLSVPQLSTELEISPSTFYRRLQGSSPWPLDHFLTMSAALALDVDDRLSGAEQRVVRLLRVLPKGPFSPATYLAGLSECARAAEAPDASLQVSSAEIPVFYLFSSPLLTALKLYLFEHTRGAGVRQVFEPEQAIARYAPYLQQAGDIWRRYVDLERQEVWSYTPLAGLFAQVGALAKVGLVRPAVLGAIADALRGLIDDLDDVFQADAPSGTRLELRAQPIQNAGALYRISCSTGACQTFFSFDPPNFLQGIGEESDDLFVAVFDRTWATADALSAAPGRWQVYRDDLLADNEHLRSIRKIVEVGA